MPPPLSLPLPFSSPSSSLFHSTPRDAGETAGYGPFLRRPALVAAGVLAAVLLLDWLVRGGQTSDRDTIVALGQRCQRNVLVFGTREEKMVESGHGDGCRLRDGASMNKRVNKPPCLFAH